MNERIGDFSDDIVNVRCSDVGTRDLMQFQIVSNLTRWNRGCGCSPVHIDDDGLRALRDIINARLDTGSFAALKTPLPPRNPIPDTVASRPITHPREQPMITVKDDREITRETVAAVPFSDMQVNDAFHLNGRPGEIYVKTCRYGALRILIGTADQFTQLIERHDLMGCVDCIPLPDLHLELVLTNRKQ